MKILNHMQKSWYLVNKKADTEGKLSEEQLEQMLQSKTWMNSKEALSYGFADEILDPVENDEPLTKSTNRLPQNLMGVFLNVYKPTTNESYKSYCTQCGKGLNEETYCTQCGNENKSLNNTNKSFNTGESTMNLRITRDESDKFRMQAVNTLAVSLGIEKDSNIINDVRKDPGATTLHGLMHGCLIKNGINSVYMSSYEVYQNAISTSDLPAIMGDVMHKALMSALNIMPGTYKNWVKVDTVNDFRPKRMLKMSGIGEVDLLPEGAKFKEATLSDSYENIQATTKGKALRITRQAMVNNETNLLRDIPMALARAIDNRKNRDCYDLLTANNLAGPTMHEDNTPLFHANHKNINSNSGPVSVESVGSAETLLMSQTDIKPSPDAPESFLNLSGKYLITGTGQRLKTIQTVGSPYDPAFAGQVANLYNNNYLFPVFDPYLQSKLTAAGKPNAWYLIADKEINPSLVICYLNGSEEPVLSSEPSAIGESLGVTFQVYHDWGYAFNDYRSIIFNDGVTQG